MKVIVKSYLLGYLEYMFFSCHPIDKGFKSNGYWVEEFETVFTFIK